MLSQDDLEDVKFRWNRHWKKHALAEEYRRWQGCQKLSKKGCVSAMSSPATKPCTPRRPPSSVGAQHAVQSARLLRQRLEQAASNLGAGTIVSAVAGAIGSQRYVREALMPRREPPRPTYLPGSTAAVANSALTKDSKWLRFQYAPRPRASDPGYDPSPTRPSPSSSPYFRQVLCADSRICTGLESCHCYACRLRCMHRHNIVEESTQTDYSLIRGQSARATALGDANQFPEAPVNGCNRDWERLSPRAPASPSQKPPANTWRTPQPKHSRSHMSAPMSAPRSLPRAARQYIARVSLQDDSSGSEGWSSGSDKEAVRPRSSFKSLGQRPDVNTGSSAGTSAGADESVAQDSWSWRIRLLAQRQATKPKPSPPKQAPNSTASRIQTRQALASDSDDSEAEQETHKTAKTVGGRSIQRTIRAGRGTPGPRMQLFKHMPQARSRDSESDTDAEPEFVHARSPAQARSASYVHHPVTPSKSSRRSERAIWGTIISNDFSSSGGELNEDVRVTASFTPRPASPGKAPTSDLDSDSDGSAITIQGKPLRL